MIEERYNIDKEAELISKNLTEYFLGKKYEIMEEYPNNKSISSFFDGIISGCSWGSKRLRPILLKEITRYLGGFSGDEEVLNEVSIAIELIQCHSIVHDDLPDIDNTHVRSNGATVHKEFGGGVAILVGDAMLCESFQIISNLKLDPSKVTEMVRIASSCAGTDRMLLGQAMDIGSNSYPCDLSNIEFIEKLHLLKCGSLFQCAALFGAILCDANSEIKSKASDCGMCIGLMMQLKDDAEDLEDDPVESNIVNYLGRDKLNNYLEGIMKKFNAAAMDINQDQSSKLFEFGQYVHQITLDAIKELNSK